VSILSSRRGGGSCTPGGNFPHQIIINLLLRHPQEYFSTP
jgi:hypothetical protein